MGGCVASLMSYQNDRTLVDAPVLAARLKYGPVNVQVSADRNDRSGIYRCAHVSDAEHAALCREWYDEDNILQSLQRNCERWPQRHAMAYRTTREVRKEVVGGGGSSSSGDAQSPQQLQQQQPRRLWEVVYLNEPTYITYAELWQMLTAFGRGLVTLGLAADDKVALYEDTRWEWMTSLLGMWTQDMVAVTVYANLGHDALVYALREADCQAMLCNGSKVSALLDLLRSTGGLHDLPIIYLDELPESLDTRGYRVVSWRSVLQAGMKSESTVPYTVSRDADRCALVMYTSGTTGNPKGVMHSLGSLAHGAKALAQRLTELIGHEEDETYVSYLPVAHAFELVCEFIFLARGVLLCYGSPRTLTDTSARPCGDITLYKPFFLIVVPRILETIKKTVEGKLPAPGTLKRRIFDKAYASRLQALQRGKDTPYWNAKVFAQTRRLLGKDMRAICAGGAPLADKTQEWVNVVLGVPVVQGYGLTETVCNGAVQRTGELNCVIGQCLRGVECCLLDTDDYKHTDTPHPRGELLLRGPFLFKGYYKQPELTRQVLDDDGWFHTGDVAEIETGTAQLRIVGRIKALAKNALGEYIALETLEALYCLHPLVTPNGICVLVHAHAPYIAALVLTDKDKAMAFARTHGIDGAWPDILQQSAFHTAAATSLAALARREGRQPFECVKYVRVLADEWTPENGLVTASMKVRRSIIDDHYASVIAELFAH